MGHRSPIKNEIDTYMSYRILQNRFRLVFVIISSQLGLYCEQRRVTLTEFEYKKLICSSDIWFYKKRPLQPISVLYKRMVALHHLFELCNRASVWSFVKSEILSWDDVNGPSDWRLQWGFVVGFLISLLWPRKRMQAAESSMLHHILGL